MAGMRSGEGRRIPRQPPRYSISYITPSPTPLPSHLAPAAPAVPAPPRPSPSSPPLDLFRKRKLAQLSSHPRPSSSLTLSPTPSLSPSLPLPLPPSALPTLPPHPKRTKPPPPSTTPLLPSPPSSSPSPSHPPPPHPPPPPPAAAPARPRQGLPGLLPLPLLRPPHLPRPCAARDQSPRHPAQGEGLQQAQLGRTGEEVEEGAARLGHGGAEVDGVHGEGEGRGGLDGCVEGEQVGGVATALQAMAAAQAGGGKGREGGGGGAVDGAGGGAVRGG